MLPETVSEDRHRPTRGGPLSRRQEEGEVQITSLLDGGDACERSHDGDQTVARQVDGRRELPERDLTHGAVEDAQQRD